ncbi:hypothetical protein BH09DEP1_BH09DEP1_4340 [soil metagenome]
MLNIKYMLPHAATGKMGFIKKDSSEVNRKC